MLRSVVLPLMTMTIALSMTHMAFAQHPQADAPIRAIIAAQAAAWNAGDGTALDSQLMEVFVRRGERWWIEAYHNVDVKPAN